MDWLRSEDLKEEKVATTSDMTLTRPEGSYLRRIETGRFRDVSRVRFRVFGLI